MFTVDVSDIVSTLIECQQFYSVNTDIVSAPTIAVRNPRLVPASSVITQVSCHGNRLVRPLHVLVAQTSRNHVSDEFTVLVAVFTFAHRKLITSNHEHSV